MISDVDSIKSLLYSINNINFIDTVCLPYIRHYSKHWILSIFDHLCRPHNNHVSIYDRQKSTALLSAQQGLLTRTSILKLKSKWCRLIKRSVAFNTDGYFLSRKKAVPILIGQGGLTPSSRHALVSYGDFYNIQRVPRLNYVCFLSVIQ